MDERSELNKKVLYISYDGMTDQLGRAQVIPYLEELSKAGFQFTIISFEKKKRLATSGPDVKKILDEAGIKWEPRIFSTRPPFLSKLYDRYRMKQLARELHRKENFALTHCRSYVAAESGLALYKQNKVPFLFDMRGFWVDERVDNGQWDLSKPFYRRAFNFYKRKEKILLTNAAHIISLTNKGRDELVKNYQVAANRITVIPCCVDLNHFDYKKVEAKKSIELKMKLGIAQQDVVLGYLGSLGGWYLTKEMLEFYANFKKRQPRLKFLFITHDKKESIVALAEASNIDTEDIIVAPASREQVPELLSVCDWSIFFIKDAYSKKASSPTKQGEIMAMGIPIICNDIGDTGQIIEATNAGFVVNDFSVNSYDVICGELTTKKFDQATIRDGAQKFFDLKIGAQRYQQVYDKINESQFS